MIFLHYVLQIIIKHLKQEKKEKNTVYIIDLSTKDKSKPQNLYPHEFNITLTFVYVWRHNLCHV